MQVFRAVVILAVAILMACCSVFPAVGQTKVDLRTQAKSIDFSGAVETIPFKTGTVLPATCNTGDLFFNTAAAAGSNLYACTASNTWSLETGGSGGSGGSGGGSVLTGTLASIQATACTPSTAPVAVATDQVAGLNVYACSSTNSWTLQQYQISTGLAATGNVLAADCNTVACQGASNNFSAAGNAYLGRTDISCVNNTSTGTTVNLLAKFDSSGNCVLAATTDTIGIVGVVMSGAGTSGSARVARQGTVLCTADNTVSAGDYAVTGTATAGRCKDSGSNSRPAGGNEILGVWTTSGAAGTLQSFTLILDSNPTSSGGGGSGVAVTDIQSNVTGAGGTSSAFLTSTVPTIPAGGCQRFEFGAFNTANSNGNTVTYAFGGTTLFSSSNQSQAGWILVCNHAGVQNAQNVTWLYGFQNNIAEGQAATSIDTSTTKNMTATLTGTAGSDPFHMFTWVSTQIP